MNTPEFDFESAHARRTDPETSHAAAASIRGEELGALRLEVLKVLMKHGPMDDTALVAHLRPGQRWSDSGIRTRRRELVSQGLVADSGQQVKLPSGRWAIVWTAV